MKLTKWPMYLVAATLAVVACNPEEDPKVTPGTDTGTSADTGGTDMGGGGPFDVGNIDEGCQVLGCPDNLVCNSATGTCVDCVTDAECGSNGSCDPSSNKCFCDSGYHLCDGTCAANDSVDSCGTSCDPCPTDPNGTATCDGSACGLTCNDPLVLDPGSNACVGCAANTDCTGPEASVCGAGGACEPCSDDSGCAHLSDRGICDGGACVECSDEDDTACGGNSCDPTGTCTSTPKDSVGACEPCNADTECEPGYGCVEMEFAGTARATAYCLEADINGCEGPTPISVTRTSVSGRTADFCTVNEALTTCEAVKDYFSSCSTASDCGAPGLDDAVCEGVEFEFAKCSFPCDMTVECPCDATSGDPNECTRFFGCSTGDVGRKWCGAF